MSRFKSGHIRLKKAKYTDLESVFQRMFEAFLEIAGQNIPENKEVNDMLLALNMKDIKAGRKPEGFNRQHSMRLIFPASKSVEMYVYSDSIGQEVSRGTETLSQILSDAGLENEVTWDKMVLEELRRKKAQASNRPVHS